MGEFISFVTAGFRGSGGPIMFGLIIILFAGIAFIIERSLYLYGKCGGNSKTFMAGVYKYIKSGEYDKALKFASSYQTPLARVVTAVLENRGKGLKAAQRAVDEVFLTESPRINRFLGFLQVFANLGVLVGLLGTVYGFMEAFDSLANVPAAQRSQALAGAIAVVMSATLWGLFVAIVNIVAHAILSTKAEGLLEEVDEKATKLINMVEG